MLISCSPDNYPTKDSYQVIDALPNGSDYTISELVKDVSYIPLGENEQGRISNVKQLYALDSLLIVQSFYSSSIRFFDLEGNYRYKIKGAKEGQHSFSDVTNFYVSKPDKKVYFSDIVQHKILEYDILKRKISDEIKLDVSPYGLGIYKNSLVVVTNDRFDGLVKMFNNENEILWSGIDNPKWINTVVTKRPFYGNSKEFLVNPGFTDTIYTVKNLKILPRYVVGSDNRSLQSIDFEDFVIKYTERNVKNFSEDLLVPYGNIVFNDQYIFIEISSRNRILIWNKSMEKSTVLRKADVEDWELLFYPILFGISDFDEDGYAYSQIMPSSRFKDAMTNYLKNNKSGILSAPLMKLEKFLNENVDFENPIIVKFKLSDNFDAIFE